MILTTLGLFSLFGSAFCYQNDDAAGLVQVSVASGLADLHEKPASLAGGKTSTRLRVNVEDYCLNGECKKYADHIENRCQKEPPKGRLDIIECFTQVMALQKGTPLEVDYFLYYGTNLAAARDGELMPYDHDLDVLITEEINTTFKFEQIWRDRNLLKEYYAKFPACERSELVMEVQSFKWEGGERKEAFHVLYTDRITGINAVSHLPGFEQPGDQATAVRMHGKTSMTPGGNHFMMDTWRVPYEKGTEAQLCHWGYCMNQSDIYPLSECTLKDSYTEPNHIVKTQCMHNPDAGAGFYGQPDSPNHFRTQDWHQPLFNVWNEQAEEWEWDDDLWKMHQEGKVDLFVYDKDAALLAAPARAASLAGSLGEKNHSKQHTHHTSHSVHATSTKHKRE